MIGDIFNTRFGHVMMWSNSFLYKFGRVKDNSFWILVARMCVPLGMSTSTEHTFCLTYSHSSVPHDGVVQYYLQEIKNKLMPRKVGTTEERV